MRGQHGIELAFARRAFAHVGEQAHPENRHGLVVFPGSPGLGGEGADRRAHPLAGRFDRGGRLQAGPRDAQVLAVMEILVADLAALEPTREFGVGHGGRARCDVHG